MRKSILPTSITMALMLTASATIRALSTHDPGSICSPTAVAAFSNLESPQPVDELIRNEADDKSTAKDQKPSQPKDQKKDAPPDDKRKPPVDKPKRCSFVCDKWTCTGDNGTKTSGDTVHCTCESGHEDCD